MAAASTGVGTLVYLHSGGPASLRLRWSAGALRLGVWDTDPTPPDDRGEAADCDGEAGRGLLLVKCVRPTSGVSFLVGDDVFGARGKYVWCELGTKADLERWDTAA